MISITDFKTIIYPPPSLQLKTHLSSQLYHSYFCIAQHPADEGTDNTGTCNDYLVWPTSWSPPMTILCDLPHDHLQWLSCVTYLMITFNDYHVWPTSWSHSMTFLCDLPHDLLLRPILTMTYLMIRFIDYDCVTYLMVTFNDYLCDLPRDHLQWLSCVTYLIITSMTIYSEQPHASVSMTILSELPHVHLQWLSCVTYLMISFYDPLHYDLYQVIIDLLMVHGGEGLDCAIVIFWNYSEQQQKIIILHALNDTVEPC